MTISEADFEQLSQLLDGELDTESRQQLEMRMALEPALASTWRDLQVIDAELRAAYVDNAATGVPREITAMLDDPAQQGSTSTGTTSDNTSTNTSSNTSSNVVSFFRRQPFLPTALAASLVLAVAIAMMPDSGTSSPPAPGLTLAAALESLPSGDTWEGLDDGSEIQAVLTFPSRDGGWCREFALKQTVGNATRRGVACRKEGQWHTEVIAQAPGPQSSDVYRPAGAGDSDAVNHFIRHQAADVPLNGRQEALLIENHWH
ncbi:MAG: hypothetical protein ABR612_10625 [Chromatocurvus sp.]